MDIWLSIKGFTAQNPELINLISLAIGFAGISLAIVFYKRTKAVKRLAFASRTFRVISERHANVAGLVVNFEGRVVPALTVTRLAAWNAGTETLRSNDFPSSDPLHFVQKNNVEIIKTKLLETSRDAIQAALISNPNTRIGDTVSLAFLDPGDGFLVEVTHTGTNVDDVVIGGSLMGGRIVRTAADPEYTVVSAPMAGIVDRYTIESYRSQTLSLARMFIVFAGVASLVAVGALFLDYNEVGSSFALMTAVLAIGYLVTKAYLVRVYPPYNLRAFDNDL